MVEITDDHSVLAWLAKRPHMQAVKAAMAVVVVV